MTITKRNGDPMRRLLPDAVSIQRRDALRKLAELDIPVALIRNTIIHGIVTDWVGDPASGTTQPIVSVFGGNAFARIAHAANPISPALRARMPGGSFSRGGSSISDKNQLSYHGHIMRSDGTGHSMQPGGGRVADRMRAAVTREAIPCFNEVADDEPASRRIQPSKKRANLLKAPSERSPEDGLLGTTAIRSSDLASSGNPLEAIIAVRCVPTRLMR